MAAEAAPLPTLGITPAHDVHEEPAVAAVAPGKQGKWAKVVTAIWDHDYYEKSAAERNLVFKLDCFMLTALTFGWWMKNIDQSNASLTLGLGLTSALRDTGCRICLTNAYVSGMKEDLKILGNQYSYMVTIYNAVMAITTIPSNIIILRVKPAYYLAGAEIGWGIFTFAQAGAKSYQYMYGFRFCVAFFESAFYPGALYILGSWYNRAELAKRIALWFMAGPAGNAFSGYLQAAIYTNLDGVAGLAGWRWLYIVCGAMTVPCGVVLLFLLPDHPGKPGKIWYLTEEEKQLAQKRCARKGTGTATSSIRWVHIVKSLKAWRFWLITPTYVLYGLGLQNAQQFAIYLKSQGYSVADRNVLASCMYLIEIPCVVIYSYISDRIKYRFPVAVAPIVWGIIPTGILAVWPPNHKLRMFAFLVNNSLYMTPVFYAWVSEICHKSDEERAFIIATTSTLFFVMNAFLPSVLFLQTDGPTFRKGFPTTFAFIIASVFTMTAMFIMHQRQTRREEAESTSTIEMGRVELPAEVDVEEKK